MKKRVLGLMIFVLCISIGACGRQDTRPEIYVRNLACLGPSADGGTVLLYDLMDMEGRPIDSVTLYVEFPGERNGSHTCTVTGPFHAGQPVRGTVRIRDCSVPRLTAVSITALELTFTDGTKSALSKNQIEWANIKPDGT